MKNKYRIVNDSYLGYEAQVKFWWFPFVWWQLSKGSGLGTNTCVSIEAAETVCRNHNAGFVKYVDI